MSIMSWLQRRPSGVYRVRRVIPERLREDFDGRTIITRGLDTRDPVVAKRKGLVVAAEIERQFAEADAALKNPTVATYKAIQKYAEEDRQRPRSDREEDGFDSWLDDRLEEEDRRERVLSERDRAMLLGLLKRNTQNNGGDDNPPLSILFDRWHAERKPPAKTWLEWKTALRCFTEGNGCSGGTSMMRVRIPFQGEMCDGEEVEFTATKEDWNVYECEDGTRVKIRFIVGKIVRLLDKRTDQGEPVYVTQWGQPQIVTQVQPHLMMER